MTAPAGTFGLARFDFTVSSVARTHSSIERSPCRRIMASGRGSRLAGWAPPEAGGLAGVQPPPPADEPPAAGVEDVLGTGGRPVTPFCVESPWASAPAAAQPPLDCGLAGICSAQTTFT